MPRCVVAAVIAGTGVRAVPAPGSGCVWVVPACVGFEAGTAGGPAARRCAYFVGRRGGGPVCWGSGFCFGRAGVCSVCGVCFVSLESASVFRCSLHAFAARAQVVCIFIRGRFRHASFLRVTQAAPWPEVTWSQIWRTRSTRSTPKRQMSQLWRERTLGSRLPTEEKQRSSCIAAKSSQRFRISP